MDLKQTLKRPSVIWTALTIILVLGALLVPIEWVRSVSNLVDEPAQTTDAFSDDVAGVDKALAAGEPVDLSEDELRALRPHLQARRLLSAGPMTKEDLTEATAMMREYNAQIATQEQEGSRQALQNERNRQLAEAFPRLDPAKIEQELAKLRVQLENNAE